jgi:hypothetical protein
MFLPHLIRICLVGIFENPITRFLYENFYSSYRFGIRDFYSLCLQQTSVKLTKPFSLTRLASGSELSTALVELRCEKSHTNLIIFSFGM